MEKPGGQKTFGSSVSFDLDLPNLPKRRRKKPQRKMAKQEEMVAGDLDCPGCGHPLSEDEWLQALVGFVSGAHAFDSGNPVQARVVQTLHNTVTNMDLPQPRDVWELSIVSRLTREFETLVGEALQQREQVTEERYTRDEVEAYAQQVQEETWALAEVTLASQLEEELRATMEPQLRREIEQALWKQFDEELQRRTKTD